MALIGSSGASLVFIHGAQNDHGVWADFTNHFAAQGYDVLAPDLPGHGDNVDAPLSSIEAMAQWLIAKLVKIGAGETGRPPGQRCPVEGTALVIVGHSMGSLVALECAANAVGKHVAGLVMIATAVPMKVSPALLDQSLSDEASAIAQINLWSHSAPSDDQSAQRLRDVSMASAQAMMARQRPGLLHTDFSACNAYTRGLEAAAAVRCPSLVIAGSHDKMTPPRFVTSLCATLPKARLQTIAHGSHSLMSESAGAVQAAIGEFLSTLE